VVTQAIAVLPEHVIDQIAAGEVVERPSSVVKELVDNALDAGARQVFIDTEGGGKKLIRVVDDGIGMSPQDAAMALVRHATSKLRSLDDLTGLATLGFRGEALPTIAAVSRLTLITRREQDLAALRLEIDSGVERSRSQVGAPRGTTVEVSSLLASVPARLKFMKGESTEAAHITEMVTRLAIAHPDVHFRLRHGGRVTLEAFPAREMRDRVASLFGDRLVSSMIDARGEEGGVEVRALLADPQTSQGTSRGVQLLVGARPIRDRGLLHAVTMGYGELVPRGRYPVAVVQLTVPAGEVDINVHPQKAEVRFADAQRVYAAVRHVVRRAIATAPWVPDRTPVVLTASTSTLPPLSGYSGRAVRELPSGLPGQASLALGGAPGYPARVHGAAQWAGAGSMAMEPASLQASFVPLGLPVAQPSGADLAAAVTRLAEGSGPAAAPEYFSRLRYLGQLDRTYLVCEGDGELVLIDQHAAHERVEFQRLSERQVVGDAPAQPLLFPMTLEVSEVQHAAAVDAAPALASVGFEVESFGARTLAVKSVPAGMESRLVGPLLRQLLTDLSELASTEAARSHRDHILATIACHSVVRAGDALTPGEVESLLRTMDGVDFRAHCPHGRPVLLRMGIAELARRLGR
jgi:DNA mismatch repair protein MutL